MIWRKDVECLEPKALKTLQSDHLKKLIPFIYGNCAVYKQKLDAAGVKPDSIRSIDDIKKLRPLVDVLIVSQHWGVHFVPFVIATYQYEVGHAAIDAGADLIIGHHAHILKGIEVYKGKVIFFGMGLKLSAARRRSTERALPAPAR